MNYTVLLCFSASSCDAYLLYKKRPAILAEYLSFPSSFHLTKQASSCNDELSPGHEVSHEAWFATDAGSASNSIGITEEDEEVYDLSRLYRATADGDLDLIMSFITLGVDVGSINEEGSTELYIATVQGNDKWSRLLMDSSKNLGKAIVEELNYSILLPMLHKLM